MYHLEINPVYLTFHRTVKVKNSLETSNLPPSLGICDIYKVSDYPNTCPKLWDKDAYFIAMHDKEAMWVSFQSLEPIAMIIGAGKTNVLSGKEFNNKLEEDNYLVTPPQPWLDGWKTENGSVHQFVTTHTGNGKTIGEQLGNDNDHALSISIFKAKHPEKLRNNSFQRPGGVVWGDSETGSLENEEPSYCCRAVCCSEMGIGKGGKIKQKIYKDPHGIETWLESPEKNVKVYLIKASAFSEITGNTLPPLPVEASSYEGTWYGLKDKDFKDVKGTSVFDELKAI